MSRLSDDGSFCSTNFDCTVDVIETDYCDIYIKKENDINCHIPCELNNCTKLIETVTECLIYHCLGKLSPAERTTHGPTALVLSGVTAIFVLVLCGVVGIFHYKTRQRRQSAAFIDNEHLVSNTANSSNENSNSSNGDETPDNGLGGAASLPIATNPKNQKFDFFENVNLQDDEVLPQCLKDQAVQVSNVGHAHSYVNYQCLCWSCTLAEVESKNVPMDKFSL